MTNVLTEFPIGVGDRALAALPTLAAVLADGHRAIVPVPEQDPRERDRLTSALRPGEPIADDIAVVVATSGTTGVPKGAQLTAAALTASANATADRIGGPGQWLLALAPHHIAGLQVLLRAVAAGTTPTIIDVTEGFNPARLPAAVAQMGSGRKYTSLVSAQLVKALTLPAAIEALAELDVVLLGGGPAPAPLLEAAAAAGITIVRTYGMSETCGGCVYDGVPLDGARLRINAEEGQPGRVLVGGVMLASGYRGLPDHPAFADAGWFRTDDLGTTEGGELRILGRLDEAIGTGGLTVVPQVVEARLARHAAIAECAVFGVPDDRLGQRVEVAYVLRVGASEPSVGDLKDFVASELDAWAAPRRAHRVTALPTLGSGKINRAQLSRQFNR